MKETGFSIDNSVKIFGLDHKARESLAQYIARAPVSLKKITSELFHGKVLFKTKYNDYFKGFCCIKHKRGVSNYLALMIS